MKKPIWKPTKPEDFETLKKIKGNKFSYAVAKFESSMNPLAENPVSSARGMFQLLLSIRKAFNVTDWRDVTQNYNGFIKLLRENIGIFKTYDPLVLYAAHYLGATVLQKHMGIWTKRLPTGGIVGLNFQQQLIVDEFYKNILPDFKETYIKTEIEV